MYVSRISENRHEKKNQFYQSVTEKITIFGKESLKKKIINFVKRSPEEKIVKFVMGHGKNREISFNSCRETSQKEITVFVNRSIGRGGGCEFCKFAAK